MAPFFKRGENQSRPEREEEHDSTPQIPSELPILPLRNTVVFPFPVLTPLAVEQPRSVRLVDEVALGDRIIGLVSMHDPSVQEPGPDEVFKVGTAAIIHRLFKSPDGSIRLFIQGLERIRIEEWTATEPYLKARVSIAHEEVETNVELQALMRSTTDLFKRLVELVPNLPDELSQAASNIEDPLNLVYLIASSLRMEVPDAQEVLELDDVGDKFRKLMAILNRELEVLELGRKIQTEAQSEMNKLQREYYLREQLKAIQRELGEGSEQEREVEEYRAKIESVGLSEEAKREAMRELDRLRALPAAAAEYSVIKNYLDWLVGLPWNTFTQDNLDIKRAREILDEDHYDIKEVKDRILEFLAVRKLYEERVTQARQETEAEQATDAAEGPTAEEPGEGDTADPDSTAYRGAILCFVGPPGVGKTSLGKSIARALGRKFIRMSLGGMRDEAEIRGHRRTYVGAMPGRIIQSIRRAGSRNPVFMLDEVDKLGADWRGDPSSALLEVLDPAQNNTFRDHYLDIDFDLSQVMFIATANLLDPIPEPLRDRMEIIRLDGYTDDEKVQIARNYLVLRQMQANSLRPDEVTFTDTALRKIAEDYTREAGVRNLEREIGSVIRKIATKIAAGDAEKVTVDEDDVRQYLGKQRFFAEVAERLGTPGVATGLFATSMGGGILFIEATRMPGGKGLLVTGQLGEVMKESAQIALSYVRSRLKALNVAEDFFASNDIHVHVPEGAIPKDGPSAGITMTSAIASLLTGRHIKSDLAMTGEITLRGRVLPVGGIKQKVLAAHRAGVKQIILPARNEPDIDELPEQVRADLKFHLVETMDQVLELALEGDGIKASKLAEAADAPVVEDGARKPIVNAVVDAVKDAVEVVTPS
ncbi:MAG: endopeptidase La [Anaerolineae bacterium]|nr:endopeptidase La [Anaerolineae bacterium]